MVVVHLLVLLKEAPRKQARGQRVAWRQGASAAAFARALWDVEQVAVTHPRRGGKGGGPRTERRSAEIQRRCAELCGMDPAQESKAEAGDTSSRVLSTLFSRKRLHSMAVSTMRYSAQLTPAAGGVSIPARASSQRPCARRAVSALPVTGAVHMCTRSSRWCVEDVSIHSCSTILLSLCCQPNA